MAGAERALNFAVRVRGVQEAAAAFKAVGASAKSTITDIAAAATAQGAYETAVGNASSAAEALGTAQAQAARETKVLNDLLKAGQITATEHAAAISGIKSGLSLFKAESQAAAKAVDTTTRSLVSAQQAAAAYDTEMRRAASAPAARPTIDQRSGVQRLIEGDASLDRAAASGTTLEQVLGRVAVKGKAVTVALKEADAAAARLAKDALEIPGPVARPTVDLRSGVDQLVAGNASLDRAAVSATTLEQVLGRVASKGPAVAGALKDAGLAAEQLARDEASAAAAAEAQAAAADRLRARYNPLFAVIQNYRTTLTEIRQAHATGAIGADEMASAISRERQAALGSIAAIKAQSAELQRLHGTSGATRAGMQQLGFQVNDVTTQLAVGTPVLQVFSQQSGQVIQSFALMAREGSTMAGVLTGPWGLAITVGVSLLGLLAGKLLEGGKSLDDMVEKLKKDGEESRQADAAHAAYSKTLEGQIDLQKKLGEQLDHNIKSQHQLNLETLQAATTNAGNLRGGIRTAEDDVTAARERKRIADDLVLHPLPGTDPESLGAAQQAAQAADAALNKAIDTLNRAKAAYAGALENIRAAQLPQLQDEVASSVDATAGKIKVLKGRLDDLNTSYAKGTVAAAQYRAEGAALQKQIDQLEKSRTNRGPSETSPFILPVSGRITGQVGDKRPGHIHQGLDIAVPVGTGVKAPAGGVVIEAGVVQGYGNVVFIDHGGGTISRLAHLSQIGVVKGQEVTQGDIIGRSGGAKGAPGAGDSQGPHVHYEVRVNGKAVDPRKGVFPTDALGAADKSAQAQQRAAEKAQRDAEKESRREQAFTDASARLDDQLLQAKRAGLTEVDALAAIARQQVQVESDKFNADVAAKLARGDLTKAEADELTIKHAILSALQAQEINDKAAAQRSEERLNAELAANDNAHSLLSLQESLALTTKDRRDLALRLLSLDEQAEKLKLEELIASKDATAAQKEIARRRLSAIDQEHPLRTAAIDRQNQGPLGKYLQDTDPSTINDRVEALVTDELTSVRDGINDAITGALGVKDPLLKGLIQILLDQVLFRPLAEALQAHGGAATGFGGLISGALGLLGGGGAKINGATGAQFAGGLGAEIGGWTTPPALLDSALSPPLGELASNTDAAAKQLGALAPVTGRFGNSLGSLISQMASGGGGGGDGGGLLGSILKIGGSIVGGGKLFGGGGPSLGLLKDAGKTIASMPGIFASGTPELPTGRDFYVGENGREKMRYHGGDRLEVISGPRTHREAANDGGGVHITQNLYIPERIDPRRTASGVARSTQGALARSNRKGLATGVRRS